MNSLRIRRAAALSGEFVWVGAGQASAVIGSLVGLRVLTGALTPAEFGSLALALTVSSLLGLTILTGPGAATLRFFESARDKGEVGQLLQGAWRSMAGRSLIVTGLLALAALPIWWIGGAALLNLAVAATFQAVCTAFGTIPDGAQNAMRHRKIVAVHAGLGQWLRWILALGLFPLLGYTAASALWGYALAALAVLGSQSLFFRRQLGALATVPAGDDGGTAWRRRVDTYSLPIALWGLPFWLHTASERWALERFSGTEAVGLYAVLAQLGFGIMTLVSSLVVQLVSPFLFRKAGDGSAARVREVHRINMRLVGAFLALSVVVAAFAAMADELIFGLLVAPEFRAASPLWWVSVLSGGVFAAGQLKALTISSGPSTAPLLGPKIGSAAVGLVVTIIGAARAGLAGVIWASLISSIVYFCWTFLVAHLRHRRGDVTEAKLENGGGLLT